MPGIGVMRYSPHGLVLGVLLLAGAGAHAQALLSDGLRQAEQRRLVNDLPEIVTVIVETSQPAVAADALRRQGLSPRHQVDGWFELRLDAGRLGGLAAALPAGSLVRAPFPHDVHVVSQGVVLSGGADMQALAVGGTGVKVGIIDMGFASLATSQANGELPADLSITDYTGTGTGGTNHGTNVAEIVYDMAPQAQLYLAKVATEVQLKQAVNDMLVAGVQIINHSVGWYGAA
ncbi:MAG TPA: hypothetical protein VIN33_11030, partial [Marinobacter sp.]